MARNSSSSNSSPSVSSLISGAIAWAVISLLFFLLFSVTGPDQQRPGWYAVVTYILEEVAYLGAALLCFRNWRSPQIVSGRGVWLAIGLGMLSYFIGNMIFGVWELVWQQNPAVSPADLFYIATYILLAWGMIQAVLPRRLSLELYQWFIVIGVVVLGILLAAFLWFRAGTPDEAEAPPTPTGIEQPASPNTTSPTPTSSPTAQAPALPETATTEPDTAASSAPGWVLALDEVLLPLEDVVSLIYIIGDVALLGTATTLLLAFWGGRFSQSWRMIAAAAFSLYIADIWFLYAASQEDYQSGSLPEVFWIFSGVLFAIGAVLEYGVSNRSRRGAGRRRS